MFATPSMTGLGQFSHLATPGFLPQPIDTPAFAYSNQM
jgi:hypothetical protein